MHLLGIDLDPVLERLDRAAHFPVKIALFLEEPGSQGREGPLRLRIV